MRSTVALCIAAVLLIALGFASVTMADQPTYVYQTSISGYYLGGGRDMVVDSAGNAYVIASYYQDEQHLDILVLKLDPEGNVVQMIYHPPIAAQCS